MFDLWKKKAETVVASFNSTTKLFEVNAYYSTHLKPWSKSGSYFVQIIPS